MKALTKADCIRRASNISSQNDFYKFDKPSFNADKIRENLKITSPKLFELMKNIEELDANDYKKYGKKFKHIIYSDVRTSIAGIKLVASVFKAYGYSNIYNSSLKIVNNKTVESESESESGSESGSESESGSQMTKSSGGGNKDNFALLSSLSVYEKQFPVKLKLEILKIFNKRPDNVHGKNVRFLLIDSGYKEGIDVYDVKYVHLVDDLITPSDEKQAIGRGTRNCGQVGLTFDPKLGWPLHVFKYKLRIDPVKYGESDAHLLFLRESKIDLRKLYFAAELEGVCRFGAVNYELNKAIHEFGNEKEDDLNNNKIFDFTKKFNFEKFNNGKEDFIPKEKNIYSSLDKTKNNEFKLVEKAYMKFGGVKFKNKKNLGEILKKIKKPVKEDDGILSGLNEPLNFITMRHYIRKFYKQLKWVNIELKNDCIKKEDNARIAKLDNTQQFISNFFTADSCYKGMLLWHSVGTGKTCTAVATASNTFERQGYTIIWVTRHTLKSDVWKNIFGKVCSMTIKEKLLKGMNIPSADVVGPLRYLDNRWIEPISYKQFTNLINGKNTLYHDMVQRNGKIDPFKKTLIIIDEAHKIFDENVPAIERPDINALKRALYNSYQKSKKDSCKLLLMTATPYTNDPMQLFKLLNLMKYEDYFDEDFDSFKDKYLDPETYKFKKDASKIFLDKITGYISYLNREKDVRQFAYPIVYNKIVEMTTNDALSNTVLKYYKLILNDLYDYISVDSRKAFETIQKMKEFVKKPVAAKKTQVITQSEAFDLCLSKGEKGKKASEEDSYTYFTHFIKEAEKQVKAVEKEEIKKAKEAEKAAVKAAKEAEKAAKVADKGVAKEAKKKPVKGTEEKICPPDKILNPATNNCVLKTGPIGKKLLAQLAAAQAQAIA